MCVVASTVTGINLVVKKIMSLLSAIEMDTGSQALMISVPNPQINLVSLWSYFRGILTEGFYRIVYSDE